MLRRLKGQPLVACAAILQHAPDVIMSRADRNIRTPADLVNARVMLVGEQGRALMIAMLLREGIPPGSVEIVPHTWSIDDLVEKRVDAMTAYATEEPIQMGMRGVTPALLRSIDYGVDFMATRCSRPNTRSSATRNAPPPSCAPVCAAGTTP